MIKWHSENVDPVSFQEIVQRKADADAYKEDEDTRYHPEIRNGHEVHFKVVADHELLIEIGAAKATQEEAANDHGIVIVLGIVGKEAEQECQGTDQHGSPYNGYQFHTL